MPEERSALHLALDAAVMRRALLCSVIVGPILSAINHGDALVAGQIGAGRWLKMGLTLMVPYRVSTGASVAARRGGVRVHAVFIGSENSRRMGALSPTVTSDKRKSHTAYRRERESLSDSPSLHRVRSRGEILAESVRRRGCAPAQVRENVS